MSTLPGSHPMRRYERADSLPTLLRALAGITAGGVLAAGLWQVLAPMGRLTARAAATLPDDTPLATSDALFALITGAWGLVAAGALLVSWRRHPEHLRNLKEATWYWGTWCVIGMLGVVTGLVLSAAAERLRGSTHPWELSGWVPLLAWPVMFNLAVSIGCLLAAGRRGRAG